LEAAESFDPWTTHEDVHPWLQNVSKFCADVLRWTNEREREREFLIVRDFFSDLVVQVNPRTKLPHIVEWEGIAVELGCALEYPVEVGHWIRTRHGRVIFDSDRLMFLFS
jgi:hypothetical protein